MPDKEDPDDRLGYLQKELYAREEPPEFKKRSAEIARQRFHPTENQPAVTVDTLETHPFTNIGLQRAERRRRWLAYAGVAVVVVALVAAAAGGTWWYRLGRQIKSEQITLVIQGPAEVTSGQEITYTLQYKNDSRVAWENVELALTLPAGFRLRTSEPALQAQGKLSLVSLGTVEAGEEGAVKITGHLLGEQNSAALLSGELTITPRNFPSGRFSKSTVFTSTITALPLDIAIDAAKDAAAGERIRATIQIRNLSSTPLNQTYVTLKGGEGVQLAVEDPEFSRDFSVSHSRWLLPTLEPLQTVTRTAVLYINGRSGERRTIEVESGVVEGEELFVQRHLSHVVTVSTSELVVEQFYNKARGTVVVKPGEKVESIVRFRSSGGIAFKNAIITLQIEGTGFNPASLNLKNGAFNPRTNTITWSAATVPELKLIQPQQQGEIPFAFSVLGTEAFPTTGEQTENFAIIATAKIDSPDLPAPVGQERQVVSDRAVLSVGTTIPLTVDAFYDDGRLGIKSSGPVPPVVGQQTTYTIRVRTGSTMNDFGDAKVVLVLPDGVRFTNQVYQSVGEVTFHERTGEVSWAIPLLPAGTGRITPEAEMDFQVAITPAEHQRGKEITFLNKVTAEGTDQFTDTLVSTTVDPFPTTETAVPNKGKVQ